MSGFVVPTISLPTIASGRVRSARSALSTAAMMRCAWRRNSCPAWVRDMPRAWRVKRRILRCDSNPWTDSVMAACEVSKLRAAAEMDPASATAAK